MWRKCDTDAHKVGPRSVLLAVDHCDLMNSCPEDEAMAPSEECVDAATDESLLETNPIQSPLQVFAGMGGLALIAERLPMLYPDVMQQVRNDTGAMPAIDRTFMIFILAEDQHTAHKHINKRNLLLLPKERFLCGSCSSLAATLGCHFFKEAASQS